MSMAILNKIKDLQTQINKLEMANHELRELVQDQQERIVSLESRKKPGPKPKGVSNG